MAVMAAATVPVAEAMIFPRSSTARTKLIAVPAPSHLPVLVNTVGGTTGMRTAPQGGLVPRNFMMPGYCGNFKQIS